MRKEKIRIRKTPYGLHLYTATMKGKGEYGWGNTPEEARECLVKQMTLIKARREDREVQER